MSSRASSDDLSFGLSHQRAVVQRFVDARYPGASISELPKMSQLDFSISLSGTVVAYAEVKTRRCTSTQYASSLISLNKCEAAKLTGRVLGVPTFAVIAYTDRIGYLDLATKPDGTAFVGRRDRGGDGTEHAFFEMRHFTWLEEPPALPLPPVEVPLN